MKTAENCKKCNRLYRSTELNARKLCLHCAKLKTEYVLWGAHPEYASGMWIKLIGGSKRECKTEAKFRNSCGNWKLAIARNGDVPTVKEILTFN